MGKQYNKGEKRKRRNAYNKRKKTAAKTKTKAKSTDEPVADGERRVADRRTARRRGSGPTFRRAPGPDTPGWQD